MVERGFYRLPILGISQYSYEFSYMIKNSCAFSKILILLFLQSFVSKECHNDYGKRQDDIS